MKMNIYIYTGIILVIGFTTGYYWGKFMWKNHYKREFD